MRYEKVIDHTGIAYPIPAEKPTKVLPAITKAIMREDSLIARCNELVTERNRAKAQAAQLAEALRDLTQVNEKYIPESTARIKAREALAAYEEGK